MKQPVYYWDSGVFCSYLSEETGRFESVRDLLHEAQAGRLEIITSSFACVEVLKLKGAEPITEEQEERLTAFFEYPFIKFVDATRAVCEQARQHVWRHGMKSKDAVHLASALAITKHRPLDGLFSWDSDFTRLNGNADIPFAITHPFLRQPYLNFPVSSELPETESSCEMGEGAEPDD